ncbi:ADP-ribosylglycohydrolase family protein [Sesbania bispinosa]|nr:ADP-ribosylglycohydrolase family protein [Sesbania bispinosa]
MASMIKVIVRSNTARDLQPITVLIFDSLSLRSCVSHRVLQFSEALSLCLSDKHLATYLSSHWQFKVPITMQLLEGMVVLGTLDLVNWRRIKRQMGVIMRQNTNLEK